MKFLSALRFFVFSLVAIVYFSAATDVFAETAYQPLEQLPGFEAETASGNFINYIESIYSLSIWIVGLCAFFMFSVGAFVYLTSAGNTSSIGTAKKVMFDALSGLILALVAWLILYVINPDLVNLSFIRGNVTSPETSVSSPGENPATGMTVPVSGTQGNCGGLRLKGASPSQCALVSASLNGVMSCMAKGGANSLGGITSLASNKLQANSFEELLKKSASCCGHSNGRIKGNPPYPYCPHANGSCHHGCGMSESEKGYIHAIDFSNRLGASSAELCKVADIAWACGAGQIWGAMTTTCPSGKTIKKVTGHETHLHISDSTCGH